MTNVSLLNLNVDTLFEQHNVPEIDIVHKKIQAVVEKKREELRTMVGERYRDLLQAADTIAAMQDSSGTLMDQVDSINSNCRSLNDQQLIGFKTSQDITSETLRNRSASKQLDNYFSTMVQVKMLTVLPELIWSHIDRLHFYTATELYVFSCHISTGLQLDAHNPLMGHLPVAKKQWEILKPFHITIKQHVLAVLEREELTDVIVANCLLSLMLLEKSTMNTVLMTFLQLRSAAYAHSLSEGAAVTAQPGETERRRVKDRILASLRVLNDTVELIGKCFLGPEALLTLKIAELTDPTCPATICYMAMDRAQLKTLPDIIMDFRPKFDPQSLNDAQARPALSQWLDQVQAIAEAKLRPLFALVTSMNIIQEIKTEANAGGAKHSTKTTAIVERFGLENRFDFYKHKYVPLINRRVRDIIQDNCTKAFATLFASLQQALPEAGTQEPSIWLEDVNDLPLSLEEALSEDPKRKRLLMRMKGYSGPIIDLCSEFDGQLAAVVNEIEPLLQEPNTQAQDKTELIGFLRETIQLQLNEFLSQLRGLNLKAREQLLCLVRSCGALLELCPHLKVCFCQPPSWRQWLVVGSSATQEHWTTISTLIGEECFRFWQQIVDGLLDEQSCSQFMGASVTNDMVLQDFTKWDTLSLEQKDEQDNAIQSNIHIPSQPRISLQSYIFTLIGSLNEAVPQTLPTKVRQDFNAKLLQQLLSHYEQYTRTGGDDEAGETTTSSTTAPACVSQKVALQLYFDLKFLQQVFGVTRDERSLFDQFQAQQAVLKDLIDPFDFELFAEPLAENVKRAVRRLQSLFGVLTPHGGGAATTTTATTQGAAGKPEMDPNVLIFSSSASTALWFPLLPIVTPSNATAEQRIIPHGDTEKASLSAGNTPTRAARKKVDSAAAAQAAAAAAAAKPKSFFGAMSQEWFR